MQVEVRRIRADEGLRLRGLRLRALADSPTAFGSTLERESQFTDDVWHARAAEGAQGSDRVTYVGERAGEWIGMATGLGDDPDGGAGPVVVGMFVAPHARRQQVGARLVDALARWASTRGDCRLRLWVTATNDPAMALYRRSGFRETGRERPVGHTPSLAEVEMVREL